MSTSTALDVAQGVARPGQGVAEPPLDVVDGGGPERPQPVADQGRARGVVVASAPRRVPSHCAAADPPRARRRPGAVVGPADHVAPARRARSAPAARWDPFRPKSFRVRGRSRPPARGVPRAGLWRWCARARRGGRAPPRDAVVEPGLAVGGDARLHHVGDQLARSLAATRSLAADCTAGRSRDVEHPQRPPHGEVLDHGSVVVQRGVEIGDGETPALRAHSDRYGVAGSVACRPTKRLRDVGDDASLGALGQEVASRQPGPPLLDGEGAHRSGLVRLVAHRCPDLLEPLGGGALPRLVLLLDPAALGGLRASSAPNRSTCRTGSRSSPAPTSNVGTPLGGVPGVGGRHGEPARMRRAHQFGTTSSSPGSRSSGARCVGHTGHRTPADSWDR